MIEVMSIRPALLFLLFQAAWFAAVLGAARGEPLWGPAAALALAVAHLALLPGGLGARGRELGFLAAAGLLGGLLDGLVARTGAVTFASPGPTPLLAPLWVMSLWVGFATTLAPGVGMLAGFAGRPVAQALLGAIGGPVAYAGGARLGAAVIDPDPVRFALPLAIAWALAVPALFFARTKVCGKS